MQRIGQTNRFKIDLRYPRCHRNAFSFGRGSNIDTKDEANGNRTISRAERTLPDDLRVD